MKLIYLVGMALIMLMVYFYFYNKTISNDPEIVKLKEKFISHTQLCRDHHDINSKICHILQDVVKERDDVLKKKGVIFAGRWLQSIWGEIIIEELYLPRSLTWIFISLMVLFFYLLQKKADQEQ